jgi:hypothetical protein
VVWGGRNELRPYESMRYYGDVRHGIIWDVKRDIHRNNGDVRHGIVGVRFIEPVFLCREGYPCDMGRA